MCCVNTAPILKIISKKAEIGIRSFIACLTTKKEYYRLTEEARSNKKLLDTPGTEKAQNQR